MLPQEDIAYLETKGFKYEVLQEGGTKLIIRGYVLPDGYTPATTDLLIEIPVGYPATHLDMYWMCPHIALVSGAALAAADNTKQMVGATWQRFSRHLAAGKWRPGRDGVASYLNLIRLDLEKSASQ